MFEMHHLGESKIQIIIHLFAKNFLCLKIFLTLFDAGLQRSEQQLTAAYSLFGKFTISEHIEDTRSEEISRLCVRDFHIEFFIERKPQMVILVFG